MYVGCGRCLPFLGILDDIVAALLSTEVWEPSYPPLRSRSITDPSSLIRVDSPLCLASVLRSLWVFHLDGSLYIEATGSQITYTSLKRTHATFPPGGALAVSGFLQNFSRANDYLPVLTPFIRFRRVIGGSLAFVFPSRSCLAFSVTLTVVCSLPPQAGCEGPSLISRTHCLAHDHWRIEPTRSPMIW